MLKTVEAVQEQDGRLRLLEKIDSVSGGVRFLVTILPVPEETDVSGISDEELDPGSLTLVSEPLLMKLVEEEEEDHGWTGL